MNTKISKNTLLFVICVVLEIVLIKLFLYDVLPNKYFYDSNKILAIMNGSSLTDKAYSYTANFFNKFNLLGFYNIKQWSILAAIILNPIIIIKSTKYKIEKPIQVIFFISIIALLNIYVFGLSKDLIQFIYFLIIYFIITKNWKIKFKLILITFTLLHEALFFRVYYAIMAMMFLSIYYIYKLFIENKKINRKTFYKIIILSLLIFFFEVFIVQQLSIDNYNAIINARYNTNLYRIDDVDAVTIIIDPLGRNNNYLIFIGNYLINFIRMNIPFELLAKSFKYIPFVLFQLLFVFELMLGCKNIKKQNYLMIFLLISYTVVSAIFEPDFGSFVRHESTLALFLIDIVSLNHIDENKKKVRKKFEVIK